jgi:hypothetical protein
MALSKKHKLQQNIDIIKQLLSREILEQRGSDEQLLSLFKSYSGFGALKCVLLPAEVEADRQQWPKSEQELFPLVQELHRAIKASTSSNEEYRRYMGSIKNSVLTAFYTPAEVVSAMADALAGTGLQANNILGPSAGATGQFVSDFKTAFPQSRMVAYEKDIISGKILQHLFPDEKIHVAGFEAMPATANGKFDVVTSNIPFGDIAVPDADFHLSKNRVRQLAARHIHSYFFLKGVDALREGGVLAFITSQGVADAAANKPIRWTTNLSCSEPTMPQNFALN